MIRKHFAGFAASALALAVSAQAFAGTVTTDGADLVIKTKGGLEVATTDKAFSFKLSGKLQWDATNFDGLMAADQNQPFDDTFNTFIRRGEFGLEGTAYSDWDWGLRVSYDEYDDTSVDRAFIAYRAWTSPRSPLAASVWTTVWKTPPVRPGLPPSSVRSCTTT